MELISLTPLQQLPTSSSSLWLTGGVDHGELSTAETEGGEQGADGEPGSLRASAGLRSKDHRVRCTSKESALVSLSLSQVTHRQVEQMLWDLTDRKNKLAYEKGKLQVCFTQTHTFCMCKDLLHAFCTVWHTVMLERSYDEHTHYMS